VEKLTQKIYGGLMFLACLAMLMAFVSIMLGVIAREFNWNIQGLDAYAGFSIAAALFLALPGTLKHGDHIRVTLVMQKLGPRARNVLEYWCLLAAVVLSSYFAYYACRLVWISYTTHDVSQSADATPLWIPQIFMALGSVGLAIAFIDALIARMRGAEFFEQGSGEAVNIE
jgi:TRAP-type C4-dicarboxylate transport system permease small subunit